MLGLGLLAECNISLFWLGFLRFTETTRFNVFDGGIRPLFWQDGGIRPFIWRNGGTGHPRHLPIQGTVGETYLDLGGPSSRYLQETFFPCFSCISYKKCLKKRCLFSIFFVQRFKLWSLAVLLHGTWGRFRQKIESVTSHFFKSRF